MSEYPRPTATSVLDLDGVPTIDDDDRLPNHGICRVPMEGTEIMEGVDFDELAQSLSSANPLSLFGDPLDAEVIPPLQL